jgi:segregation and condensation protein B
MKEASRADIIEALLFASDRPVPLKKLAQVAEVSEEQAREEVEILREEKRRIGALQLVEVGEGWQMVTKPAFAPFIRALRDAPKQKLSRAAFEVLAIVAYRQPVTRAEVESLRAVDCAGPLQLLIEKKLVAFAGRKEVPGRPWLYSTTPQFLDFFGLRALEDLPSLSEWELLNQEAQANTLFNRGAMAGASVEVLGDEDAAPSRQVLEGQSEPVSESASASEGQVVSN